MNNILRLLTLSLALLVSLSDAAYSMKRVKGKTSKRPSKVAKSPAAKRAANAEKSPRAEQDDIVTDALFTTLQDGNFKQARRLINDGALFTLVEIMPYICDHAANPEKAAACEAFVIQLLASFDDDEIKEELSNTDEAGLTPLHHAVAHKKPNTMLIRLLLAHNADIFAENDKCISPYAFICTKNRATLAALKKIQKELARVEEVALLLRDDCFA